MKKKDVFLDTNDYKFLASVKLSIHRALLSEIIPSMRAIYIDWNPKEDFLKIYFFHSGKISPAIQSHYSSIMAEVSADYWGRPMKTEYEVIECDYPNQIPVNFTVMVYERKEPFVDPK